MLFSVKSALEIAARKPALCFVLSSNSRSPLPVSCGTIWGERFDGNPCATLHRCTLRVTATVCKNEENGSGWKSVCNVAPLHDTCHCHSYEENGSG